MDDMNTLAEKTPATNVAVDKTMLLRSSTLPIVWPKTTGENPNYVIFTDEKALVKGKFRNEKFVSDILLKVPSSGNLYTDAGLTPKENPKLELVGDVLCLTDNYQHSIVKARDLLPVGKSLAFNNERLGIRINAVTGDYDVSYNTDEIDGKTIDSDLEIKYIAILAMDTADVHAEKTAEELLALDENRTIVAENLVKDYSALTDTQKAAVNAILTKMIYDNKQAKHALVLEISKKIAEEKLAENTPLAEGAPVPAAGPKASDQQLQVPFTEEGAVDTIALTNEVCPKFGNEVIDWAQIEVDDKGYPVISDKDITNLGYLGVKREQVLGLLESARTSISMAEGAKESAEKFIAEHSDEYHTAVATLTTASESSSDYIRGLYANYMPAIVQQVENEREIETSNNFIADQKNRLAGFQNLSRIVVTKGMEDGDFTAAHTFNSTVVYNKAMHKAGCITGDEDNFGTYNTFLRYVMTKTGSIVEGDANYFDGLLFSFVTGRTKTSKAQHIHTTIEAILRSLVRTSDIKNVDESTSAEDQSRSLDMLMQRIKGRIDFIYMLANYPVSVAARFCKGIVTDLSFGDEAEVVKAGETWDTIFKAHTEKGWAAKSERTTEQQATIIALISEIKRLVLDDVNYEKIVGFIKLCKITTINEYAELLGNSHPKNLTQKFSLFIEYDLLMNVVKYVTAVADNKIATLDKEGKECEETINRETATTLLIRFLIESASMIVTSASAMRIGNAMTDAAQEIDNINPKDAATFFASTFDSLIIPHEILERGIDTPEKNSDFKYVISDKKLKLLGKKTVESLFKGLQGYTDENNTVSRLSLARSEIIEKSNDYTIFVFTLVVRFLNLLCGEDDTE